MFLKKISVLGISLLLSVSCFAQSGIKGNIKTQDGKPLPFAAIAVRGTNSGTISNEDGKYLLELDPGYYEIIFQYLGFKNVMKSITIEKSMTTFDLVMQEEALNLGEVRISDKDEDPAYNIDALGHCQKPIPLIAD